MTESTEFEAKPRKERLKALVRIEDKVAEAAEAAADAAAHAVEAVQAAEAATAARAANKSAPAKAAQAARTATTAKTKARKAAGAAKAASAATDPDSPLLDDRTQPLQQPTHALDVRLTDDELAQIKRLAAKQDLPVPELARSLLVRALNRSGKPQ